MSRRGPGRVVAELRWFCLDEERHKGSFYTQTISSHHKKMRNRGII